MEFLETQGPCPDRDYLVALLHLFSCVSKVCIPRIDGKLELVSVCELLNPICVHKQGSNKYLESVCQASLSVTEIFTVLNSRLISFDSKIVYAEFLVQIFLLSPKSEAECNLDNLPHNP